MERTVKVKFPAYAKTSLILISLALIVTALELFDGLLVPLSFSFLFALLLHPLCVRLEMRRFPRVLAIFICLIAVVLVLGSIMFFIATQLMGFTEDLPELHRRFGEISEEFHRFISSHFGVGKSSQLRWIRQSTETITNSGSLTTALTTTTNIFTDLGLIPVFVFFFLYYRQFFKQFLNKIFNQTPNRDITEMMLKIQHVVQNYLTGLLLVMAIVAALNTISLLLLGVDYALFFGSLAALLTIIPYLGVFIGSLLPALMALLTKDSAWYAVGVVFSFGLVQVLEGNFITPNIVGSKVSVNPLAAIIALILGGILWGPAGMILSIPFTAILKVILDSVDALEPFGFLLGEPPVSPDENPYGDFMQDIKQEVKEAVSPAVPPVKTET